MRWARSFSPWQAVAKAGLQRRLRPRGAQRRRQLPVRRPRPSPLACSSATILRFVTVDHCGGVAALRVRSGGEGQDAGPEPAMELPTALAEQLPWRRGGGGWAQVLGTKRAALQRLWCWMPLCAQRHMLIVRRAGHVSVRWSAHEHEKSTFCVLLGYLHRGVSGRQVVSLRGVCWLFT
jgi:hypothetical protein